MFQHFSFTHFVFLLEAARWTLLLAAIGLVGGGLLGALVAFLRICPLRPLRWLAGAYIYVVQGTPLLVLLFIAYFGLADFGLHVPPLVAAGTGFVIYASAFLGEIWRGVIESVGKGQWEGGMALALTWRQTLRHVVVPQALRVGIPPTVGFSVQVVKNTAVASIVGFVDLTRAGQIVASATFQPLRVYLAVAAIYFVLCASLSWLSRVIDRRMHATLA